VGLYPAERLFPFRAKGSLTDPEEGVKWSILVGGLPAVFLQQGLGHLSRLVVPPQTLVDEFIDLILVGLHKNRFEDVHPLVDGNGRRVFVGVLIGRHRGNAHEDVPDEVLHVRENAALGQIDGVSELMVCFDKPVLVLHSRGPLENRFSPLTPYHPDRASTLERTPISPAEEKGEVDRRSNNW